jgi:hypothetical protein
MLVVPTGVLPVVVSVKTLVVVAELGLNDAVTPLGRPDAARFTLPVKPLMAVIVIVLFVLFPCVMAALDGPAESE